jgi:dihydrodipicolinate synthase/N-acetylneuraminate lyase
MMVAHRPTLSGVWVSVLLPVGGDDLIDWAQLSRQVEWLADSEADGVYAHGTAGEFHTLTEPEFERVSVMLAEACAARGKPFQIGASHMDAGVSLRRVVFARDLGPVAIQVIVPDWLRLTPDETSGFLRRAAEIADPVPLVLYNPPRARTHLSAAEIVRVVTAVPQVIGIKTGAASEEWFAGLSNVRDVCSIFVPGHLMASGLLRGGHGSYSNIGAMSPGGAVRWRDQIVSDPQGALDLERRIAAFFDLHVVPLQAAGLSDPALDKFLAVVGGRLDIGLTTRWPMTSAPESSVAPARSYAAQHLPELVGAAALSVDD